MDGIVEILPTSPVDLAMERVFTDTTPLSLVFFKFKQHLSRVVDVVKCNRQAGHSRWLFGPSCVQFPPSSLRSGRWQLAVELLGNNRSG